MNFNGLLHRTNLECLQTFLKLGAERLELTEQKPYAQRIAEATAKADAFFAAHFPDRRQYDEVSAYFYEQASVYEDVYFEIGFLLGAKLGCEIQSRLQEL